MPKQNDAASLWETVGRNIFRKPNPRPPVVWALAGAAAWIAGHSVNKAADSLGLLLTVLAVVAFVAGGLVALPRKWAHAVISVLLVLHFGGILTAVTSVPPPGGQGSWLANQLWFRFYRPYLQFMYLNNAYHFYSPEPGPATLLWARVEYANGTSEWCEFPRPSEDFRDPLGLEYYRRVAMNESINQLTPTLSISNEVLRGRLIAGEVNGIPSPEVIGMHLPGLPQYRVPADTSKQLLQSYARFIALQYAHADAKADVAGVKVYRVTHAILSPGDFAEGRDPLDPTLFFPYYQGEFDKEGNLKNPDDPYLYWLIPILRVQKHADPWTGPLGPPVPFAQNNMGTTEIRDFLAIHAGSKHWEVQE